MKKIALNKREKYNTINTSNKIDQDELWEDNLMKQLKSFETKGLEEARQKLKDIKKELKKDKKKKHKRDRSSHELKEKKKKKEAKVKKEKRAKDD